MAEVSFFVPGTPRPGGSKTAFPTKSGKIALVDASGKAGRSWRSDVKVFAKQAYSGPPMDGPVCLRLAFRMPRPKSHYRTGKRAGELRDGAPFWHTSKPDLTKLVRSVEDALTGILWRDDAQIGEQIVDKQYAREIGVLITVWQTGRHEGKW